MKLVNRLFLVLALWAAAGAAQAQSCATLNPPACTFLAIDFATGLEVSALCVGRPVQFVQCPGRNIPQTLLFYGVLPGVGTTYQPSCNPPNPLPYIYTPTAANVGMVTVSELANLQGNSTYYIRTFRVYDTPAPAFTAAPCPNGLLLVTVTDAAYDSYAVRFNTGPAAGVPIGRNQPVSVPVPAGATSVSVTGRYAANGLCEGSATQPLTTLPLPQVPAFTRLTLQGPLPGGVATLDVGQLPAGYNYTLQVADGGGFRNVTSVPAGSTSVQLPNPAAGCYRLFRSDVCGGSPAASPLLCTLSLAGTSTQNRNQLLLADAGAATTTYTVTRNGVPLAGFTAIAGGLEDADVQCGTTYTYRVTARQPGGGVAVSNEVAIATRSALPPAQPQLLASFNRNNVVELTPLLGAPLAAGSTLRYRRAAGSQPPTDFGSAATTARGPRDSTALSELRAQPPCYTARLTDVCGNASPESTPACPALLTASAADPAGTTTTLTWTSFTGPNPSVAAAYSLQRLAPDGAVLSAVAVSGNAYTDLTPPTDRQVLRYRLQISGAGLPTGTFSYSNLAAVPRQPLLTIPTAFTPNGDGLNDVLEVKGRYLRDYVFVVVDRNGQEVFRGTQRLAVWDGTIRGRAPVLGTYAWRFQQTSEDGQPFTATGSVTILK